MFEVLRGNPREVVIRLSGGFDETAGTMLARCIEELPRARRVVVDFSQLRSLEDVDLGAVARGLAGHSDLCFRGLGRHHLRLLRYCGVQVPATEAVDEEHQG
jgi:hypothetical protein